MANPAPTINQINAFNATQGTTIDFNIIGGTELIRSNRIYIYDLSDNSLICTHLYVSTESIHELPPNTDGSIVYESGKSSADFVNGAQYYAQIQTYTDTNGTQGGSGLSVAKMFWCLGDPTLTVTTIPSTISTTSYNISATYTDTSASVVSNIIQQYQFNLYSATGSLLQSSGVVVGSGTQQGTSDVYDISHNFTGLNVGSSYYVTVDVTTTQGMSVNAQSNTFTVSIDTPTLGEATVVNNACDGYISVTSNLSGEYGGNGSGEIVSFETDSEDIFTKLQVDLEPIQEGSGNPSPSNVRPIRGHSGVDVNVGGKNLFDINKIVPYNMSVENGELHLANASGGNNNIQNGQKLSDLVDLKVGETYTLNANSTYSNKIIYLNASKKGWAFGTSTVITQEDLDSRVGWYGNGAIISNIQIELGSTATPYEPYQQPQTITQDFNVSLTPTSTDTTPYLFKAVGDIYGDRLEDKIVGGTVAWNQLAQNGDFATDGYWSSYNDNYATYTRENKTGKIVVNSVPSEPFIVMMRNYDNNSTGHSPKAVVGHKYLFSADVKVSESISMQAHNSNDGLPAKKLCSANEWTTIIGINKAARETMYMCIRPSYIDGIKVGLTFYAKNVFNIDLTQMFGSTIADYIYSLEKATAGAGVAWFKKLFPNDYYAYNAGELLSVEGLQSHDAVGFNQFDKNTMVVEGVYIDNANGAEKSNTGGLATDFIPVIPNATYFINTEQTVGGWGAWYDANKNYISGITGYANVDPTYKVKTAPSNAHYMRLTIRYNSNGNPDTLCINLSNPTRNGEYEPYKKHSYPLDSSLTLRGIPKLDASNNLYYDGDEYTSDGKVKRKYGVVDLGTLNWTYQEFGGISVFTFALFGAKMFSKDTKMLCEKYPQTIDNTDSNATTVALMSDKQIQIKRHSNQIYIKDSGYTDATTFKAAMSGVMLVYELATPTTETATPYTNPQIVSKYGTLEYVTNSIVPVGHKTTYLTRDIFGGYVDLISGKLVVDRVMVTLDGSADESFLYFSAYQGFRLALNDGKLDGIPEEQLLSNIFVGAPSRGSDSGQGYSLKTYTNTSDATYVFICGTGHTTVSDFKDWLSNNNTQIVYPLATPQTYQLTPQQVNTLVGTNNVWGEQGNIELSYHIPITNLLVKRQDVDDVSGGWLTLYSQPITQASDMDFTFIDFLNQYGKTYKYALVPLLTQTQSGVEVEVEGGYTVSNEVQSVFDGVFIADSTGSQKCKANVGYGNVDMNQVVGSITPIGAKYPIIVTNSHNQYHNGSISGTIVPDDYYFNGNLSRIDMVNKRNELEQFLTNKRVKVIKDWNGNIWLVMIAGNVSCTFNNNYGMGIVSFSTNWTEVGDPTNQQDLQATGLIDVGGA